MISYRPNVSMNFITNSLILIISIFTISLVSSCSGAGTENLDGYESKSNESEPSSGGKAVEIQKRANIDSISSDLLFHIGSFLNNPYKSLGPLNSSCRDTFHQNFLTRFNIPELMGVDKSEPELPDIFNLAWCRNDPFLLFGCLFEDISSGKKPYKVIFRPLIWYLARTFKELTMEDPDNFIAYFGSKFYSSFEIHMANICAKNGHFDLVFEFLIEIPEDLIKCLTGIEDRQDLMKFFKSNSRLAIQYEHTLIYFMSIKISDDETKREYSRISLKWITDCILYDAPEEFYNDMFNLIPELLKLLNDELFFRLRICDVPESEYPRIHFQMRKLINVLTDTDYDFYSLINDIRFGNDEPQSLNLSNFDEKGLVFIAEAAFFGNKLNLFLEIYDKFNNYTSSNGQRYTILDSIVTLIELNNLRMKKNNCKLIYKLIASVSSSEDFLHNYLRFLAKLYAVKGFKLEGISLFIFEFVALEDLMALVFPPKINVKTDKMLNQYFINYFIENVFSYIKVVDEQTVSSFLAVYKKSHYFKKEHFASIQLLELISKSPNLLQRFKEADIKFRLYDDPKSMETYLNIPNVESIFEIFYVDVYPMILAKLKTKRHLEAVESIQPRTAVSQYLLDPQSSFGEWITESDYFQWRLVFSYWIRSYQRQRIREITSPAIIKLLKLEFPEEMNHILPTINGADAV